MDSSLIIPIEKAAEQANETANLLKAFDAVCDVEDKMDSMEKEIVDSIPKTIDPCDSKNIITKLLDIVSKITKMSEELTLIINSVLANPQAIATAAATAAVAYGATMAVNEAKDALSSHRNKEENDNNSTTNKIKKSSNEKAQKLNDTKEKTQSLMVDAQYLKYYATQIILKKYQIIKYRVEYIQNNINLKIAEITKDMLISALRGKADATNNALNFMMNAEKATASTISTIIGVMSNIINAISSSTILNVNGSGMAFFYTPKSIVKVDIPITNSKLSINHDIPDPINIVIEETTNKMKKSNAVIKKARIASMAAAGAASAVSETGFDPGSFGSLPKIDTKAIRESINIILQSITEAQALPRYEKLSITNIRFLTFLMTGFEPAGKRTFGIPGYP